ncbi:MAG TPA: WbqC family protein [Flavobacteriaceae bacterium]|nr:WbqC family protein [Flavobacteriaceae bacterium]
MALVQPHYFSPIAQYVAIAKASEIQFEVEDNFQKQTYRNRCYIYSPQGKQLLSIPIKHNKGTKQKTKEVIIDYKENWQKNHLKALYTAYNSSPFFEFYIDDLLPVFNTKYKCLLDLNFATHRFVMDALQLDLPQINTTEFNFKHPNDFRGLSIAKTKTPFKFDRYIQVFETSHGFIPNLSILDLIFMEGPNALNYLEQQTLNL